MKKIRGNFCWVNGIDGGKVVFIPNVTGTFYVIIP